MRNPIAVASIFLVSVLLWGCPYKSQVALSEANEPIKKDLIGKWIPQSMETQANPEYYVIAVRDSFHYDIDHFQFNEEEKGYTTKSYVGHTTQLKDIMFFNLQESGQREFLIHRMDVNKHALVLFEVTDNIDETFKDAASMQAFFIKHMHLSFFYNHDEVTLIRKGS